MIYRGGCTCYCLSGMSFVVVSIYAVLVNTTNIHITASEKTLDVCVVISR